MSRYIYLIAIVVMSVVVHLQWFFPGVFSYGDWWYTAPELLSEFKFIVNDGIWQSVAGLGAVDPQIYFFPLHFIRGILSFLPYTDYWGLFFVYFLPIVIIPPIAFFFLVKRFIPDNLSAFIGSVAYTFATCFLTMQTAHLTIGLAYAIAPLLLLAFVNFLQDKNKKLSSLILVALATALAIIVEPRIFYILIIILLPSIFLIHKFFARYILLGIYVILLNLFWLLPLLTAGTVEVYTITNRPLFGNEFRSLKHALTGMQPAWSWEGPEPFEIQPIYVTFWFIPIFVFTGMFLLPKQKRSVQLVTLFMYIIALLGIFLAKQSHPPLPEIYGWLYEHFPGFNLYRESSKFYTLIAIAYAYLIAFTFYAGSKYYKEKKVTSYNSIRAVVAAVLLGVLLIGTLPLLKGSFGSMFVHREISKDYELYKNFILEQNEYFRTVGVPKFPRWGAHTVNHPKVDTMNLLDSEWAQYNGGQEKVRDKIVTLFNSSYINHLLDVSSIKYVFVPIRDVINEDDFFTFIDNEDGSRAREEYVATLEQIKNLRRIDIGTQELVVYQNDHHKSHIRTIEKLYNLQSMENIDQKYDFITSDLGNEFDFVLNEDVEDMPVVNVQSVFELPKAENDYFLSESDVQLQKPREMYFETINPTKKIIHVKGAKDAFYIVMSENYHDKWILMFNNGAINGIFDSWWPFVRPDVVESSNHFRYMTFLNGWYINIEKYCKKDDLCTQNDDGTYDVEFVVEFFPQRWFYLGVLVSGTLFFGLLGLWLITFLLGKLKVKKLKNDYEK